MKRYSEQEVRDYLRTNGGYNLLGDYNRTDKPIIIEKDGYKCSMSFEKFLEGKSPRFFSKRSNSEFLNDNIALFIKTIEPEAEFIEVRDIRQKNGKYRKFVKFRCPCGIIHEKTWEHIHIEKRALCSKCGQIKAKQNRKTSNTKRYARDIKKAGYELVNPSQQLYANKLVEVIEIKTGYRGFLYSNRATELKKILVFSLQTNKKNLVYNLNKYAENTGNTSRVIGLIDTDDKVNQMVECKCGNCGKIYQAQYRSFMQSRWLCEDCNELASKYENAVGNFLSDNNIKYITQFIINSCADVRPLPFDFQLPEYNVLIEVDGLQHFEPCRFGGVNEEIALKKFEYTKKHDAIKNEYCKKFNIPLLRISYKEVIDNSYKQKILDFIQTAQN